METRAAALNRIESTRAKNRERYSDPDYRKERLESARTLYQAKKARLTNLEEEVESMTKLLAEQKSSSENDNNRLQV